MRRIQFKSLVVVVATVLVVSVVSYFGLRSSVEADVYRAVFEELKRDIGEITLNGKVVVLSKPSKCHINLEEGRQWEDIPKDVMQNFISANSEKATPVRLGSLEGFVPIINWEDNQRLHKAGYRWKPTNQNALALSRVGLNYSLNRAVLCLHKIVPAMLGSSATMYILEKKDGEWVIKIWRNIWVS